MPVVSSLRCAHCGISFDGSSAKSVRSQRSRHENICPALTFSKWDFSGPRAAATPRNTLVVILGLNSSHHMTNRTQARLQAAGFRWFVIVYGFDAARCNWLSRDTVVFESVHRRVLPIFAKWGSLFDYFVFAENDLVPFQSFATYATHMGRYDIAWLGFLHTPDDAHKQIRRGQGSHMVAFSKRAVATLREELMTQVCCPSRRGPRHFDLFLRDRVFGAEGLRSFAPQATLAGFEPHFSKVDRQWRFTCPATKRFYVDEGLPLPAPPARRRRQ